MYAWRKHYFRKKKSLVTLKKYHNKIPQRPIISKLSQYWPQKQTHLIPIGILEEYCNARKSATKCDSRLSPSYTIKEQTRCEALEDYFRNIILTFCLRLYNQMYSLCPRFKSHSFMKYLNFCVKNSLALEKLKPLNARF